jgi:RNA polymerase sigma factor (sigma-70 family)
MQPAVPSTSGADLFLSQLELIERVIAFVCSRNHVGAADCEEFGSFVKLKLVEHDYAVLGKFEGRSTLRTYLTVVIQRLFLDYRVNAWGKWRPSAKARRLGATAVQLEQLLVRDGFDFESAYEVLKVNHGVTATRAELEKLAAVLPIRVKRHIESDEVLKTVAAPERPADDRVAEGERAAVADRASKALRKAMARFDARDRLIIALRFEDGRSVTEIATILGLEQKAAYRRVDRLLEELRRSLESDGIDRTAIRDMFESPAVSVDWAPTRAETAPPGPSTRKGAR